MCLLMCRVWSQVWSTVLSQCVCMCAMWVRTLMLVRAVQFWKRNNFGWIQFHLRISVDFLWMSEKRERMKCESLCDDCCRKKNWLFFDSGKSTFQFLKMNWFRRRTKWVWMVNRTALIVDDWCGFEAMPLQYLTVWYKHRSLYTATSTE